MEPPFELLSIRVASSLSIRSYSLAFELSSRSVSPSVDRARCVRVFSHPPTLGIVRLERPLFVCLFDGGSVSARVSCLSFTPLCNWNNRSTIDE